MCYLLRKIGGGAIESPSVAKPRVTFNLKKRTIGDGVHALSYLNLETS